jgi:hypothetical protein
MALIDGLQMLQSPQEQLLGLQHLIDLALLGGYCPVVLALQVDSPFGQPKVPD